MLPCQSYLETVFVDDLGRVIFYPVWKKWKLRGWMFDAVCFLVFEEDMEFTNANWNEHGHLRDAQLFRPVANDHFSRLERLGLQNYRAQQRAACPDFRSFRIPGV